MVIAMVETLIGVDASAEIAGVDGVDAVFVASGDLGSFSGRRQGEPEYEALVDKIKSGIESAGKYVEGRLLGCRQGKVTNSSKDQAQGA